MLITTLESLCAESGFARFLQTVKWQISRVHVSTKYKKLKEMEEEFSVNMNEPLPELSY
jgi:hypothetical protein